MVWIMPIPKDWFTGMSNQATALMTKDGILKVTDFGLTKTIGGRIAGNDSRFL